MENPNGYPVLTDADVAATKAPERDWAPWLPPAPLPDTGPKVVANGQVWAGYGPGGMPGVFEVWFHGGGSGAPWADMGFLTGGGGGARFNPQEGMRHAVLVQDVGQPEPTPPDELYGLLGYARVDPARGSGVIRATPPSAAPWKAGQRRLFTWNSNGKPVSREGFLLEDVTAPNRADRIWLARESFGPGKFGPGTFVIGMDCPSQLLGEASGSAVAAPFEYFPGDTIRLKKDDSRWLLRSRVVQVAGPRGRRRSETEWSELLAEAPAPNALSVGYTFTGDELEKAGYGERAYLRRPMDPEKVARARAAIDKLTARTMAPKPERSDAEAAMDKMLADWDAADDAELRKYYDKVAEGMHVAGPPLREVSSNGREWVNYDKIDEVCPFDSYKRRRVDGVDVGYVEPPVLACEGRVMSKDNRQDEPCRNVAIPRTMDLGVALVLCDACYVRHEGAYEKWTNEKPGQLAARDRMAEMDRRASAGPPVEPSCQPTLFGGIWRPW